MSTDNHHWLQATKVQREIDGEGFQVEIKTVVRPVDTAVLAADRQLLVRVADRYTKLRKQAEKAGDPDGLAPFYGQLADSCFELSSQFEGLRSALSEGVI